MMTLFKKQAANPSSFYPTVSDTSHLAQHMISVGAQTESTSIEPKQKPS